MFIVWDHVMGLYGSEITTHAVSANNTTQHNTLPIQTVTISDAAQFPALQQQSVLQSVYWYVLYQLTILWKHGHYFI